MLVKITIRRKLSINGHNRPSRVAICVCDTCLCEFTCYTNVTLNSKKMHHFCSKKCASIAHKRGGIAYLKKMNSYECKFGMMPWHTPEARIKQRQTNMLRYGVSFTFHTNEARDRSNSVEGRTKAHETMKRNGTYGKSKPEDRLYEVLCEIYNIDNVERQALVKRWPIDFYVKSIDAYVQYDSYWHGFKKGILRDIDEVAERKTKHDVTIHGKMLSDISQNAYFAERNMRLIRVQNLSSKQISIESLRSYGLEQRADEG